MPGLDSPPLSLVTKERDGLSGQLVRLLHDHGDCPALPPANTSKDGTPAWGHASQI